MAPIAIFAFNRPAHLRRALEAVAANPEASHSPVTIYCDGPRSLADVAAVKAVREVARKGPLRTVVDVRCAETNRGLAGAIIEGVSEQCARAHRVIVLEDDLIVSRHFLRFMNEALTRYESRDEVVQISGHCFPATGFEHSNASSFLPFTTTLGWGTWQRAWRLFDPTMRGIERLETDDDLRWRFDLEGAYPFMRLLRRLRRSGELHRSWGIRWHWSVLQARGLVLYPHRTLVCHAGNDDSGMNVRGRQRAVDVLFSLENHVMEWPPAIAVDQRLYGAVRAYLAGQQTLWKRGLRFARRFLP